MVDSNYGQFLSLDDLFYGAILKVVHPGEETASVFSRPWTQVRRSLTIQIRRTKSVGSSVQGETRSPQNLFVPLLWIDQKE